VATKAPAIRHSTRFFYLLLHKGNNNAMQIPKLMDCNVLLLASDDSCHGDNKTGEWMNYHYQSSFFFFWTMMD